MKEKEFINYINKGYKLIPLTETIKLEDFNPIDLYESLSDQPKSYLFESLEGEKNWSRYTIIGFPSSEYIEVIDNKIHIHEANQKIKTIESENPIDWIDKYHKQFKALNDENLPQFQGGLVGFFGFDTVKYIEPKIKPSKQIDELNTPDICLILSKELLIYDKINNLVHIIMYAENNIDSYKIVKNKLSKTLDYIVKFKKNPIVVQQKENLSFETKHHFDKSKFLSSVKKIKDYILNGDVMQVVLSQRMSMPFTDKPIDFYKELRNINPSPYMYYLNMGEYFIIGSSPEILVRLENNLITVRPIAGTRPRSDNSAEDIAYERELIKDPKENAEHLMLIDLGRNDVGKVAKIGTVKLTDKMIIERYSHVMHMVSNVTGEIANNLSMMDVLKSTFPAGTVSGAPKIRAMEIIYELEPIKRGIYAGAIGYLGWNGNMDTAIAIRTCVIKDNKLNIQCGAGIVNDSIAESEWTETLNKGKAIIQAYKNIRVKKL